MYMYSFPALPAECVTITVKAKLMIHINSKVLITGHIKCFVINSPLIIIHIKGFVIN